MEVILHYSYSSQSFRDCFGLLKISLLSLKINKFIFDYNFRNVSVIPEHLIFWIKRYENYNFSNRSLEYLFVYLKQDKF